MYFFRGSCHTALHLPSLQSDFLYEILSFILFTLFKKQLNTNK